MISVKLMTGDKAQIFVGQKAERGQPLDSFGAEVRALMAGQEPGFVVYCEDTPNPQPATVKPLIPHPEPTVRAEKRPPLSANQRNSNSTPAQKGTTRPTATNHSTSAAPEPADLDKSDHRLNPYNFAQWESTRPWMLDRDLALDGHARWAPGRCQYSGTLEVTLTAMTPILVPEGNVRSNELPTEQQPLRFWRCHRAVEEREHIGIPGSSIKGVIRSLFEAWTNSRVGFLSEKDYERPVPYRRRSADAWVITAEADDGEYQAMHYEVCFCYQDERGEWFRRTPRSRNGESERFTAADGLALSEAEGVRLGVSSWQVIKFRANLLWSPKYNNTQQQPPGFQGEYGAHRWTHLIVKPTNSAEVRNIAKVDACRYRENIDHQQFSEHLQRVSKDGAGRNFYQNAKKESEVLKLRRQQLKELLPGTLLFAIPDPKNHKRLSCFGKNVNFLWPSVRSPKDLIGSELYPRSPESSDLAGADIAEATFGFAGTYSETNSGHPFRGRVRPTTFWATGQVTELPAMEIGPLMSPLGVKLKARPLYLAPGTDNCAANYDEGSKLRGRKMYWHQPHVRPPGAVQGGKGAITWARPLGVGATFKGEVVFENLRGEELGALLASIDPRTFFGAGSYGIKIGKGKPLGLGSVEAKVTKAWLRKSDGSAYSSFLKQVEQEDEEIVQCCVAKFKAWLAKNSKNGNHEDIAFVRDLKRLLAMPGITREYQAQPARYGWMPALYLPGAQEDLLEDAAKGDPDRTRGSRPIAMPLTEKERGGSRS